MNDDFNLLEWPSAVRWFRACVPVGALRAEVEGLSARMRVTAQLPGRAAAGLWRSLCARRDAARRKLEQVERFNEKVELKRAMLADALWRARVLAELGGLAALTRWERGWAKMCARVSGEAREIECGSEVPSASARVRKAGRATWARTDRSGQFRLMALARGHYVRDARGDDANVDESWEVPDQRSCPGTVEVSPGESSDAPRCVLRRRKRHEGFGGAIPLFADELRGEGVDVAQRRLGAEDVGRALSSEFEVLVESFVAIATHEGGALDDKAKPP